MKNKNHISKSMAERQYYNEAIKKLNNDSTIDDSLKFSSTDNREEDLRVSETKRTRKPKIKDQIIMHVKDNWIVWAVAGIGVVILFFIFNFNRDMGNVEGKVSQIDKTVDRVNSTIDKIKDKQSSQDVKINENKIKIKYCEKMIESKKRR